MEMFDDSSKFVFVSFYELGYAFLMPRYVSKNVFYALILFL